MPLKYKQNTTTAAIMAGREAYTQWCLSLSLAVQSQDAGALKALSLPKPLLDNLNEDAGCRLPQALKDELSGYNANLLKCAQALQKGPDNDDIYTDFLKIFAAFSAATLKIEEFIFQEEAGFNLETKLKNAAQMEGELAIEMERLSRGGPAFSLALAQVDDFDVIKQQNPEIASKAISVTASAMLECMRSFDDAYYVGENEFILCLKQTETSGGLRAFERFEEYLDEHTLSYEVDGEQVKVTMSCCVSEPVAEDDLSVHLKNLREDTKNLEKSQGSAFTFQEISPLQRYMKT